MAEPHISGDPNFSSCANCEIPAWQSHPEVCIAEAPLDIGGQVLHLIFDPESNDWNVWLDTEVMAMDGLVIGGGATRAEAIADAKAVLTEALRRVEHLL